MFVIATGIAKIFEAVEMLTPWRKYLCPGFLCLNYLMRPSGMSQYGGQQWAKWKEKRRNEKKKSPTPGRDSRRQYRDDCLHSQTLCIYISIHVY